MVISRSSPTKKPYLFVYNLFADNLLLFLLLTRLKSGSFQSPLTHTHNFLLLETLAYFVAFCPKEIWDFVILPSPQLNLNRTTTFEPLIKKLAFKMGLLIDGVLLVSCIF